MRRVSAHLVERSWIWMAAWNTLIVFPCGTSSDGIGMCVWALIGCRSLLTIDRASLSTRITVRTPIHNRPPTFSPSLRLFHVTLAYLLLAIASSASCFAVCGHYIGGGGFGVTGEADPHSRNYSTQHPYFQSYLCFASFVHCMPIRLRLRRRGNLLET